MPRWEPNPGERLERAAMTLFAANGFDATTVDEIAEAAGMARSGFFRHYRDKRDVFSGGQNGLASQFVEGMRSLPPGSSPLKTLNAGFDAIGSVFFTADRHHLARQRFAVIASSTDLQERELLKRRDLTDSVSGVLIDLGMDELQAGVAAELAALAFARAVIVWGDPNNNEPFSVIANQVLKDVDAAARHSRE